MANVAYLGTGLMGAALAEAAAKRGDRVTAWNRTLAKARALEPFGIRVANDVEDAVRGAERIHLILSDDAAVDGTLRAAGTRLDGKLVIDHTTASPKGTAARALELQSRGASFLHAPVFMSPQMCREARGLMFVSGPKDVFSKAEVDLGKMTGSVSYLGERADLAAAYKLFGNAMIVAVTAGLADVYALARSLGIQPTEAHGLFSKFNPAAVIAYRGSAMARGDYTPSFELTMARKDVRLMLEVAHGEGLFVLPAIAARMDSLIASGFGGDDLGVLSSGSVPKKKG